jgi:NAD(P)-dependent dehydrogenase (short-subunit alcohol dehydrogenase family)
MDLTGRVALVTGAGRGVGEATAIELSRAGAVVAVCDIDLALAEGVAAAIRAAGGDAAAFGHDVSRPEDCDRLVTDVGARRGRLDILVNNAAICPRIPLDAMTEGDFDRIVGVNLKSVFFLSRATGRAMKTGGWGRIVNVSSTGGRTGGLFNATVYSATKAGVIAMTKSFARMFAGDGILVNCVAPGSVNTRLMANISQDALEATLGGVPLGRLSDPAEIARVIAFLASEDNSYMTGATVDVNGGAVMA